MTDHTDGTFVDAILDTNIESFEFENCGFDFDDLLNDINEGDFQTGISSQPPTSSLSLRDAPISDFPTTFPHVPPGAVVSPFAVPYSPSQPRSARYPNGQTHPGSGRQISTTRDGVAPSHRTSLPGNGSGFLNVTTNVGSRHRLPSATGCSINPPVCVEDSRINLHHLENSRNQHDGSVDTLGLGNHLHRRHSHHPGHAVLQQVEFPTPNAQAINQRIQGNGAHSRADAQSLLGPAPGFGWDCLPNNVDPMALSEAVANDILENLMNDREEMQKFIDQVVLSDNGQLHQILNPESEGQSHHVQNQQFSSVNTETQPNGVQARSLYPDTPPESGSEANSPPDNLPSMAPDASSNGGVCNVGFTKLSTSPPGSSQSTLPPYHSNHLTASGSTAGGNTSPNHYPVFAKVTHNQPLDPQVLLNGYNRDPLNHKSKKRKHSISPQGSFNPNMMKAMTINAVSANIPIKPVDIPVNLPIKPEPVMVSDGSEDDTCGFENPIDGINGSYQVIKWSNHMMTEWSTLVDESGHNTVVTTYRVDADKGFNFSSHDESFICQKKNHFQVTIHVTFSTVPKFLRSADSKVHNIDSFCLNFHGIKMESPNQKIKIEQSQSDRSKRPLQPVRIDFGTPPQLSAKAVIGRLHFGETTTNNMRKRGKPNPDQRYFQLVVSLVARSGTKDFLVAAQVSERIIVRASNPGQFDGDGDSPWNKGKLSDSIFHTGNVGINTENADEALTVHGNIKLTGHVIAPSDIRAKTDLKQLDTSQQLKNISQINVYHYRFNKMFAEYAGLDSNAQADTGVLAQEVSEILPDAVEEVGDVVLPDGERIEKFLVVNKDRIFIEGIGAVKELCKVTDKLEDRISEIEVMNRRLKKYGYNRESTKSTQSECSNVSTCSSVSPSDNSQSSSSPDKLNSSRLPAAHLSTHRHHHHHHHCRHHQQRQNPEGISRKEDKGLCGNRVVQVIIIILVLIMALCLVAITLLYVLEVANSDENVSVNPTPPVGGGGNQSGTTNKTMDAPDWTGTTEPIYETTTNHSVNKRTDGEPLVWPDCTTDDCPVMQCCLTDAVTTESRGDGSDETESRTPATVTEPEPDTFDFFGQTLSESIPTLLSAPSSSRQDFNSATVSARDVTKPSIENRGIVPMDFMPSTGGNKSNSSSTTRSSVLAPTATYSPTKTEELFFFASNPAGSNIDQNILSSYISTTHGTSNGATGQHGLPSQPGQPGTPDDHPGGPDGSTRDPNGRPGSRHGKHGGLPPGRRGPPGSFGFGFGPSEPRNVPRFGRRNDFEVIGAPHSHGNWGITLGQSGRSTPKQQSVSLKALLTSANAVTDRVSPAKTTASDEIKVGTTQNPYPKYNAVNQFSGSSIQGLVSDDPARQIIRERRFIDMPPQLPLADVYIRLYNETRNLTTDYCLNDDCRMQRGSRLLYEVSLGPAFPWLPIELEFVVRSENFTQVTLCNTSFVWNCNSSESDENVTEVKESLNDWMLPVGMFLSSEYTFRIPSPEQIGNDVCQESPSEERPTFREYIVTFSRECYIQQH